MAEVENVISSSQFSPPAKVGLLHFANFTALRIFFCGAGISVVKLSCKGRSHAGESQSVTVAKPRGAAYYATLFIGCPPPQPSWQWGAVPCVEICSACLKDVHLHLGKMRVNQQGAGEGGTDGREEECGWIACTAHCMAMSDKPECWITEVWLIGTLLYIFFKLILQLDFWGPLSTLSLHQADSFLFPFIYQIIYFCAAREPTCM